MTRANPGQFYQLDSELERNLRKSRRRLELCNIPGYPSSGPRGCQITTAQCTPTPHPSPSIHTGWVVASGNRTPNLTFNTSGTPADATSCAAAQLVFLFWFQTRFSFLVRRLVTIPVATDGDSTGTLESQAI